MSERDYRERVAAGVAYLDKYEPDWWELIDLDRLDMYSCEDCVIGQLHDEDYDPALGFDASSEDKWEFGHGRDSRAYTDLADEWKRIIIERRAAGDPERGASGDTAGNHTDADPYQADHQEHPRA